MSTSSSSYLSWGARSEFATTIRIRIRIRIILFCQHTTYRNGNIYKKDIITYMPTWRLLLRPLLVAIIGPPSPPYRVLNISLLQTTCVHAVASASYPPYYWYSGTSHYGHLTSKVISPLGSRLLSPKLCSSVQRIWRYPSVI